MSDMPTCDLYLRLSDLRTEQALDGREAKLTAEAGRLGWLVHRVVIENDMVKTKDGRMKAATAFGRRKITVTKADGKTETELRTVRPGFREVLDDITAGRVNAMLAEDLDRVVRDPRDLEDLLDACALRAASARSLTGSLTLTEGGTDAEKMTARIMVAMANKSSADTSRRVKEAKDRLHGESYCGGQRPYGFVAAADTAEYHKTLLVVPDEAAELRDAADRILAKGFTLAAVVRDLRERGIPTVNGGTWSTHVLKKSLLKPAIAGKAVHTTEEKDEQTGEVLKVKILKPAPWDAILEPDEWERLKAKLNDPARRANGANGNEPRWLLSGIGKCGICNDGTTVIVTGVGGKKHGGPSYTCRNGWHLRRNAHRTDEFIEAIIVARLSQPDVKDILKPPVKTGIDTGKLRAEVKKLHARKTAQMKLHSAGIIDDADLVTGMKDIKDRLAVAEAQLVACTEPDPIAEFRDAPAEVVWAGLILPRKRAVVKALMGITFLTTSRRGPGFDPGSVAVERYA